MPSASTSVVSDARESEKQVVPPRMLDEAEETGRGTVEHAHAVLFPAEKSEQFVPLQLQARHLLHEVVEHLSEGLAHHRDVARLQVVGVHRRSHGREYRQVVRLCESLAELFAPLDRRFRGRARRTRSDRPRRKAQD